MAELNDWAEFEAEEEGDDSLIKEYDITATPNDFNIKTIFDFVESGAVKIPGFQRNYVWDIKRASKLIESIIVGLPIPQIFLYEETRNKFLVIDGQQRLMSIYYFIKQRFPKIERRVEIRKIFDEMGELPKDILHDDNYFDKFNLQLPSPISNKQNKFDTLNYETLGEHKIQFDLRPVRNIIIRQNSPDDEDSSIYEIFNRLNSGGINLTPQEIRASLYHSGFYMLLDRLNLDAGWRRILGAPEPDLHKKDVEILLRGFALLIEGDNYRASMTRFLNGFSRKAKRMTDDHINYCEALFKSFVTACSSLESGAFLSARNKFNISTFDAVFSAICKDAYTQKSTQLLLIDGTKLASLKVDQAFFKATQGGTASADNVKMRIKRAKEILI
jgi:hypothetical protein